MIEFLAEAATCAAVLTVVCAALSLVGGSQWER